MPAMRWFCETRFRRLPALLRVAAASLPLVFSLQVVATASAASENQCAAIASAHPLATGAGLEVLKRGGNAFDAAVAVAAALAVVEPYSSGLGGGGFWLLHRARDGFQVMVDGREVAPLDARPELYFDSGGRPIPGATRHGGKSVAVPGVPAALDHIARRYGSLSLATSLAPAIRLAHDGFSIGKRFARIARLREKLLQGQREASHVFLDNGRPPEAGFVLRQPQLAGTMEAIATEGRDGFYRGRVAQALVKAVNAEGGVWQPADLERYRVIEREPLVIRYRGATITTVTLPSAGGIALAQALRILGHFDLSDPRTATNAHLVVEALRQVFRDRALYLGDSDVVDVPLRDLLSSERAVKRAAEINPSRVSPSNRLQAPGPVPSASGNTTHLSVLDCEGNRVAATLSINLLFGSAIVAPGTGVLLNDEMDDFSLQANLPNAFRLRGGLANAIAPGKRPLSSMTPAFVDDAKGTLILGSPGGSRIVSQVLLAILDYVGTTRVDLAAIVSAPRFHHQWWPDQVEIERGGFSADWRASLQGKGHRLSEANRRWGNMQAVFKSKADGSLQIASDPRGVGVGWY